ncbi:MAG: HNH endonuclease [Acidobacteriia bacterium]|nr:HNH endonuclease [Terriglobia bacterium]
MAPAVLTGEAPIRRLPEVGRILKRYPKTTSCDSSKHSRESASTVTTIWTGRGTIDHYIPLSKGGTNFPDNIVLACWPCNNRKRAKLPSEFRSKSAK